MEDGGGGGRRLRKRKRKVKDVGRYHEKQVGELYKGLNKSRERKEGKISF